MTGMVSATAPLLRYRRLRKTLPDGRRLLDIDTLAIHANACLLLTGANGAGKSTLLRIIAALEPPDAAEVEYRGLAGPWHAARDAYRHEVIYVHQQPYLFDRSVAGNIAYGLRRAGLPKDIAAQRVARALDWAGLVPLAARNARTLSGGERQRVALARAWVLEPRVLLLDEPLANLDEESRERTYFLIARLRSEGTGVVVTSHDTHGLTALADVWLHLHNGQLQPRECRARGRRHADPTAIITASPVTHAAPDGH